MIVFSRKLIIHGDMRARIIYLFLTDRRTHLLRMSRNQHRIIVFHQCVHGGNRTFLDRRCHNISFKRIFVWNLCRARYIAHERRYKLSGRKRERALLIHTRGGRDRLKKRHHGNTDPTYNSRSKL